MSNLDVSTIEIVPASLLENDFSLFGVTEQGQGLNITRDWDDLYQ